jgi:choline dehydrogenase-like flavoprotein
MTQQLSADVIVVGAGTSGCYFAWRLSQAGFRTLVLEKQRLSELGRNIDIFHMDEIRKELYQHFPESPAGFDAWRAQAQLLWGEA